MKFLSNKYIIIIVSAVILFFAFVLEVSIGTVFFTIGEIFHIVKEQFFQKISIIDPIRHSIIWDIRFPRAIIALLVGAVLAGVGATLQGVLRNPLSDPYIIGTSSGAALGAALVFAFGLDKGWQSILILPICACAGAVIIMALVFFIAKQSGGLSIEIFLLAGVVLGSFVWALITFLLTLSRENIAKIMFWLMGSLSDKGWWHVAIIFPYAVIGLPVLFAHGYYLNLLTLGEEKAIRLGVDVEKTKRILLIVSIGLTACTVSVSGIIGFLGLLVPHIARFMVGADHRILLPVSFLSGGTLLLLSDLLARTVVAPAEIPVGVVTALLGAPFFCYILWKNNKKGR